MCADFSLKMHQKRLAAGPLGELTALLHTPLDGRNDRDMDKGRGWERYRRGQDRGGRGDTGRGGTGEGMVEEGGRGEKGK